MSRGTFWLVLVLLVVVLFLAAAGGGLGSVEFGIWFLLLLIWAVAFYKWRRKNAT